MQTLKSNTMAGKGTCRNIRLELADNAGFIIKYDEYTENKQNTYDGMSYVGEKELSYSPDQQSQAIAKLLEIGKKAGILESESPAEDKAEGYKEE